MNSMADFFNALCAKELGYDNRAACAIAHEESHNQVNQRPGGTADGGQRFLVNKIADNQRVNGIVQLLKRAPRRIGTKNTISCFQITPSVMALAAGAVLRLIDFIGTSQYKISVRKEFKLRPRMKSGLG